MSRTAYLRFRYILSDCISVTLCYFIFNCIRYTVEDKSPTFGELYDFIFNLKAYVVGIIFVLFWIGLFALSGYYNNVENKSRLDEFPTTIISTIIGSIIVFMGLVVDDVVLDTSVYLKLYFYLFSLMTIVVYPIRFVQTTIEIKRYKSLHERDKILLIMNDEATSLPIEKTLREEGKIILDKIMIPTSNMQHQEADINIQQHINEIETCITKRNPDIIVVYIEGKHLECFSLLLYGLYKYKIPIKVPMRSMLFAGAKVKVRGMKGEPFIDLTDTNMSEWEKNVKWLFDKICALILLIITSPIMLILAISVKFSSKGPIIFKQERIGLYGKPFMIYKFRTMYTEAECNGPQLSKDGDKRITKVGRTLRKYRLDELPQFWNVLKGDMSFVGPRPERSYYIKQLVNVAPYYYLLHNVRPGITSWGMVKYGYASNLKEMEERLEFDWLYYENMSLQLDLAVLCYTIYTLIKGSGK